MNSRPGVIDDLAAEQDRLESVLARLTATEWLSPSAAAGWTVADVVLHLAQTEEAVPVALSGAPDAIGWRDLGDNVDDAMDALVRAEPAAPAEVFARWRAARRASVAALRTADPTQPVQWVASLLKPPTLATTRLAEHWAHALETSPGRSASATRTACACGTSPGWASTRCRTRTGWPGGPLPICSAS
ncbi:maleylpyruvate isomerase N-terminal domain-containing protein [Actinoplanes flavus]|uniref:Maleylpyruvate isomerase N-terminal domain-containing protein n=1 Tax=Actinoplanes flavus TaxID=2820290 RepID=A0ABS3UEW8_9ACTN|nr:maleylpyruvate isomerase N-terminal domain-containing protein [Actinoplanes flavus]MBO3737310.1 maleylpyruvate isomerase N-terminal domain-containing protein [Actinoplanes flavus]